MECSTNEKLSLQPDCLLHAPESRCGLNTAVNTTVIYEHLIENLITGTIIPDSHKLHKVSYFKFALFLNRIFLPMHSLVLFSSVILFLSFFFFFFFEPQCYGIISIGKQESTIKHTTIPGVLI